MQEKEINELNYWKREAEKDPSILNNPESDRVYKTYLQIDNNTFKDKIVVDVGCGPLGILRLYNAKLKFGVDHLINEYSRIGYKLLNHDIVYLCCKSEEICLIDGYADFVISRNALDHVDDFYKTMDEIHRILKRDGELIFAVDLRTRVSSAAHPRILNKKIIEETCKDRYYDIKIQVYPKGYNDNDTYEVGYFKGRKR